MEQLANNKQKGAIGALVAKLHLEENKADLVASFSGGRCTSSKDLYSEEANALITHLRSQDPDEIAADKMRKKMISLAHEAGYRIPGTKKVDMKRLDEWCKKYGYLHKSLDNYTLKELPLLITQFEKVKDGVLNSL